MVSLISSNYVETVNVDKVMNGAMHGLADGLDPDSAYLTPERSAGRERRDRCRPAMSASS